MRTFGGPAPTGSGAPAGGAHGRRARLGRSRTAKRYESLALVAAAVAGGLLALVLLGGHPLLALPAVLGILALLVVVHRR